MSARNVAYLFPIYFAAIWILVCFVISWMSGWHTLAASYRTTRPMPPNTMHLRRGTMRLGAHYNGSLTLGSDLEGLYLAVLPIFRLWHPRLFIPWSHISVGPVSKQFFQMRRTLSLGLQEIPLTISQATATELLSMRL